VDPAEIRGAQRLDWDQLAESAGRALGGMPVGAVVGR
jgi:hypothetical protein